ncbi:gamma-secretase subunit Aph-1 [Condylostylus longicornis]|uniref:gamma-secretase subunit Aph-1 n=1 Tax=Condylostylus longicornis TaxID=2530218 RepID=UPI00244E0A9A|nr:gamma-secretase subunit Aph-1 [Condylostylus longicornis]
MTIAEFFGCAFLAFGPPMSMFILTVAIDPIRIIIMIAASFFWVLSILLSSIIWFIVVPLRDRLWFGAIVSILLQELFRYVVYKLIRKSERGLQDITESSRVVENKHILAYVSGLGFGIISGLFALSNVLADLTGPATMGLNGGTEIFFIISAAQTLCMIFLHTFWSIIFFNAWDTSKYTHVAYVVFSHLLVSLLTLFNKSGLYTASLIPNYIIVILTGILAFKVAGGSFLSFKRFVTCK